MPARRPFAYLRKSRIVRGAAIVSPEMQLEQVTALAAGYGDHDLTVLSDLGISGRKGRAKRPGFAALLDAIEAGQCSAAYSYSLSRISRSTKDILALAERCAAAHVPIRLAADQDPDPTTASGRMVLTMLAAMATYEADVASERALDIIETRRARGDRLGPPLYPEPERVVDAYKTAGSFAGAAKMLTAEGVPTMTGARPWRPTTVRQIVLRTAPGLAPRYPHRGAKGSAPFVLYRLLRCSHHEDDVRLTGTRRPGSRLADYRCTAGRTDPSHPRPVSVAESKLLPWVIAEAARLRVPSAVEIAGDDARRDVLAAKRDRWAELFATGRIDLTTFDAKVQPIDEEIARLPVAGRIIEVPRIDWDSDEPGDVNAVLRAMWQDIELDEKMRPVRAKWFDRRLRAD